MKMSRAVVLEGRGKIVLHASDHIATGGEGSTYRKGQTVVKIYTDPSLMQRDNMVGKIKRLSQIVHPSIVAPQGIVTERGKPVGYYMAYVQGEGLSRVFTNTFWKREGFTKQHAITLVEKMRDTVHYAHGAGAILVDANEMNWLVTGPSSSLDPRVIDVDSWAIEQWRPTVIMPSIRDWHTKGFNELTDWFAWGIVTFQIFTGIHPYKGTLAGYKRGDLEGRMKANASVFMQGVKLNNAVRDFSMIPGPLHDWYVALFHTGERSCPPSARERGVAVFSAGHRMRRVSGATGTLVAEKVYDREDVTQVFPCGVIRTQSGKVIDVRTMRELMRTTALSCEVIRVNDGWLIAETHAQGLQFHFVHEVSLHVVDVYSAVSGRAMMRYGNRLFIITDRGLTEVAFQNFARPVIVAGMSWQVMAQSTTWFDGVGVQDAFGATYAIMPFGEKACAHVRVPELDALRIITASAGERFGVFVGIDAKGLYQCFTLTFTKGYKSYSVQKSVVDQVDLNVTILPKGVTARIVEDGKLDIIVPSQNVVKTVEDTFIRSDMILTRMGDSVYVIKDGALWSLRMK